MRTSHLLVPAVLSEGASAAARAATAARRPLPGRPPIPTAKSDPKSALPKSGGSATSSRA